MSKDFFRVKKGLNIKPTDPTTVTDLEDGDIIVDSTDNQLKKYSEEDGEFSTIAGSGGTVANFFSDFDKLTPTVSNATVADDSVTFLPIDDNKKSKKATFSAAGSVLYEVASEADLEGNQGLMTVWIKTSLNSVTISTTTDGAVESTLSVLGTNKWKQYEIPFVVGGTDQGFIVEAGEAGDVFIDEPFVGLAPAGYIQQVGQAHFVGSATETGASGCNNQVTPIATGVYYSFPADTDCNSYNNTGDIQGVDNEVKIIIKNARTDGTYKISLTSLFVSSISGAAAAHQCTFDLFEGNNRFNNTIYTVSNLGNNSDDTYENHLYGTYKFDTTGDKIIEVKAQANRTDHLCAVINDDANARTKKWEVYFYPDSASTIVSQDQGIEVPIQQEWQSFTPTSPTLTYSQLEGRYKRVGDSALIKIVGVYSGGTGGIQFGFSEIGTADPTKYPQGVTNNFYGSGAKIDVGSNLAYAMLPYISGNLIRFYAHDGSAAAVTNATFFTMSSGDKVSLEYTVPIQGWESTETKQATIIGKFENIKSTVLARAEIYQGTDQIIPFSAETQLTNISNTQYAEGGMTIGSNSITVPRTAKYNIKVTSGTLRNISSSIASANSRGFITFKVNGSSEYSFGTNRISAASPSVLWSHDVGLREYVIELNANDTLTFFAEHNYDNTLNNVEIAGFRVNVAELPDTSSIVKNLLAESSQTKCQTKYLSADVTSTISDIADLKFTGLTIGKRYSVNSYAVMGVNSDSSISLEINHDSQIILRNICGNNAGISNCTGSSVGTFIASDTVLSSSTASFLNTSQILYGNGTRLETHVTLCQLPDTYVDTDEW